MDDTIKCEILTNLLNSIGDDGKLNKKIELSMYKDILKSVKIDLLSKIESDHDLALQILRMLIENNIHSIQKDIIILLNNKKLDERLRTEILDSLRDYLKQLLVCGNIDEIADVYSYWKDYNQQQFYELLEGACLHESHDDSQSQKISFSKVFIQYFIPAISRIDTISHRQEVLELASKLGQIYSVSSLSDEDYQALLGKLPGLLSNLRILEESGDVSWKDAVHFMMNYLATKLHTPQVQDIIDKCPMNWNMIENELENNLVLDLIKFISENSLKEVTELYNSWKRLNPERFKLALKEIFLKDECNEFCKKFLFQNLIPQIMSLSDTEDNLKESYIELATEFASIFQVGKLSTDEYNKFTGKIDDYIKNISELRDNDSEYWHKLWIFLVRIYGKKLHNSMSLINRLLRVVEHAFRNSSYKQRLRGYDCWKELIDNRSLDSHHLSSEKQLKLLLTPLRAKFSKQDTVIVKRFEVFVYLIEKLQDKAVLVLNDFLEFCFGEVGENTDPSKAGQGKSIQELWHRSAKVMLAILGHSHDYNELCLESEEEITMRVPLLNSENITKHYHHAIYSVTEACVMLRNMELDHVRQNVLKCFWGSLFNIILYQDMIINKCSVIIGQVLERLLRENDVYQKSITVTILKCITRYDWTKSSSLILENLEKFINIIFSVPLSETSHSDIEKFQTLVCSCQLTEGKENIVYTLFDCFMKYKTSEYNANFVAQFWIFLVNELEENDKNNYLNFLLWPAIHLGNITDTKKEELIVELYKNIVCKFVEKSEELQISLFKNFEKLFKDNPLLFKNILSLVTLFDPKITNVELIDITLDLLELLMVAPLIEDSSNQRENLHLYFGKFFNCNVLQIKDNDTFKKIYTCLQHILKQKHFEIIDNIEPILKSLPDRMKSTHCKYISLDFLMELFAKETDLFSTGKIHRLIEIFRKPKSPDSKKDISSFMPVGGRSAKIANLIKQLPPSSTQSPNSPSTLRLFGKDIETHSPLKVKGSQLKDSINSSTKISHTTPSKKAKGKQVCIDDESNSKFVLIETEVKIDKNKLTEHQKETLKKRREDIPALYQDLSQSNTQNFDSNSVNEKFKVTLNDSIVKNEQSPTEKSNHKNVDLLESKNVETPITEETSDYLNDTTDSHSEFIHPSNTMNETLNESNIKEEPIPVALKNALKILSMDIVGADEYLAANSKRKRIDKKFYLPDTDKKLAQEKNKNKRHFKKATKNNEQKSFLEPVDNDTLEVSVKVKRRKSFSNKQISGNETVDEMTEPSDHGTVSEIKSTRKTKNKNRKDADVKPKCVGCKKSNEMQRKNIENPSKEDDNAQFPDNMKGTLDYNHAQLNQSISTSPKRRTVAQENNNERGIFKNPNMMKKKPSPTGKPSSVKSPCETGKSLNKEKGLSLEPASNVDPKNESDYKERNQMSVERKEPKNSSSVVSLETFESFDGRDHCILDINKTDECTDISKSSLKKPTRDTTGSEVEDSEPKEKTKKSRKQPTPKSLSQQKTPLSRKKSRKSQSTEKFTQSELFKSEPEELSSGKALTTSVGTSQLKYERTEVDTSGNNITGVTPMKKSIPLCERISKMKSGVEYSKKPSDKIEGPTDDDRSSRTSLKRKRICSDDDDDVIESSQDSNASVAKVKRSFSRRQSFDKSVIGEIKSTHTEINESTEVTDTSDSIQTTVVDEEEVSTEKQIRIKGRLSKSRLSLIADNRGADEGYVEPINVKQTPETVRRARRRPRKYWSNNDVNEKSESHINQTKDTDNQRSRRKRKEPKPYENSDKTNTTVPSLKAVDKNEIRAIRLEEKLVDDSEVQEKVTIDPDTSIPDMKKTTQSQDTQTQDTESIDINDAGIQLQLDLPEKPILDEVDKVIARLDTASIPLVESDELCATEKTIEGTQILSTEADTAVSENIAESNNETKLDNDEDTTQQFDSTCKALCEYFEANEVSGTENTETQSKIPNGVDVQEQDSIGSCGTPGHLNSNLPSSPVTGDTPNRTSELLNCTSDISPIAMKSSCSDLDDVFIEERKLIPVALKFDLEDADLENNLEKSPEKADDAPEKTNGMSPEKTERDVDKPTSNTPPRDEAKTGREIKSIADRSNRLFEMTKAGSPATHRLFAKRKSGLSMSPSASRIKKLMSNVKIPSQSDFSENISQEDILTFSRDVPSPLAVPRSSILKRKHAETADDGLSPCPKRKRVNFSDPCTTSKKLFIKDDNTSVPPYLFGATSDEELDKQFLQVLASNNIVETPETETENIQTEPSLDINNPLLLRDDVPIYPDLVDCEEKVSVISRKLTSPMFVNALLIKLKEKNIKTIGDLARQSEVDIARLPFKTPMVTNVYKALDNYYHKFVKAKTKSESRLNEESDSHSRKVEPLPELKVALARMDVQDELLKVVERARIENVSIETLCTPFFSNADRNEVISYMKSRFAVQATDVITDADFPGIVRHMISTMGIQKVFEIMSQSIESPEDKLTYEDCLINSVNKKSLPKFIGKLELHDLQDTLWKNVESELYTKQELLDTCFLPFVNPVDLTSVFNKLTVVELEDMTLARLENEEYSIFMRKILEKCGETSEVKTEIVKYFSVDELTCTLVKMRSPKELITSVISTLNESADNDNQDLTEIFRIVSDSLLKRLQPSKLMDLTVELLKKIPIRD